MSNPPRTPAECFSTILLWLSRAVDAHYLAGRISGPLIILIRNRIRSINQRFARLAGSVGAGKYVPRRSAPRKRAGPRPRGKNPLPQGFAWLVKLVPEAAVYGSRLRFLFAEPEMAALLAAAPAAMGRPLRSLCHMLGVRPSTILTPAARPRPPRAVPAAEPQAPPLLPPLPVSLPRHRRTRKQDSPGSAPHPVRSERGDRPRTPLLFLSRNHMANAPYACSRRANRRGSTFATIQASSPGSRPATRSATSCPAAGEVWMP